MTQRFDWVRQGVNWFKPWVAELQQIGTDWHRKRANQAIAALGRPGLSSGQGVILCEALWDHPYHWLRVAMLRRALTPKCGGRLVGLYTEETPLRWRSSLESLLLAGMVKVALNFSQSHNQQAAQFLCRFKSVRELCAASLPGGCPAAYIYDGALKQERVGHMEFSDARLRNYFALAFCYLEQYQGILTRNDISAAIVSHPTHVRFSTLVWKLIEKEIPVYLTNYVNGHVTIRKITEENHMLKPYDDSPEANEVAHLNRLKRTALIELGDAYMAKVRGGNESEFARVKVYGAGKSQYDSAHEFCEALGADPEKPIVAIMGNCWPDFPNGFGPTWFADYADWFRVTLKTVAELPHCNWVLKPHPAESEYGHATTLRKLAGERLPSGVFHWPESASGVDLASHAHGVVTARGTSGVEYACIGLRVIAGAPTSYTGHGFVQFAETEKGYRDLLVKMHQAPAPSRKQQEDALLFSASTFAHPPGQLRYPDGHLGRQLYRGLPCFIRENRDAIESEIKLMTEWVRSGHGRFHTWRMLCTADGKPNAEPKPLEMETFE